MTAAAPSIAPAATVILVRETPGLEVLMVRRHADMAFGASAWVFPGGKVAEADADERWFSLLAHGEGGAVRHDDVAYRIAAAREAFEECGVLLARSADGATCAEAVRDRLNPQRQAVEADPSVFRDLIAGNDLRLDITTLTPFAHWVTPAFEKRRYDTRFYLVRTPEGQSAAHDGREAVAHVWATPAALLEARRRGEAKLMFPTRLNLELLAAANSISDLVEGARRRPHVVVSPEIVERDGRRYLRIPEEAGYSVVEEAIENVGA